MISTLAWRFGKGTSVWVGLTIAGIVATASAALFLGADANWDLKNYHLYGPYSVWAGRHSIDHHPAGIQGYLNPTLDLLSTYPLLRLGNLSGMSLALGGLQGLSFVLLVAIAWHLLRGFPELRDRERMLLAGLSALLGMTGAMVISEIGTTFGDLTTALLVLSALLCYLYSLECRTSPNLRLIAVSGLAVGVATGLKLTNAVFLVALFVSALVFSGGPRKRSILALSVAAGSGILLSHGWWSWRLWEMFGNPVFPFFNNVFRSPYYSFAAFADERFMPWSLKQAIVYPFYFSWNAQTAEVPFRDFRFPVAYIMGALLVGRLLSEKHGDNDLAKVAARRAAVHLGTFIALSYILWLSRFSVQRYAVAIELLLPVFILIAFLLVFPRYGRFLFVAAAMLLYISTTPANCARLHFNAVREPIVAESVRSDLRSMLQGGAVVLGPAPLAYLPASLRESDVAWFGEALSRADAENLARKLSRYNKVFAISHATESDVAYTDMRARNLGLRGIDKAACREFETAFDDRLLLCPVRLGSTKSRHGFGALGDMTK
jgi:hypothetical protein